MCLSMAYITYKSLLHACTIIMHIFVPGFFGIIFEEDRDTAYSVQRCWQSLGFAISFVCSLFFNVLWLLVPLYAVTMMMFMVAEWRYNEEMKKTMKKCCGDCQGRRKDTQSCVNSLAQVKM